MFRKNAVVAAVIGGFLLIGAVVPSQARDRNQKCEQRVRKAEVNLRKAIQRHGERSGQAEQRRRELEQARRGCQVNEHRGFGEHDYGHDREYEHR